MEALGRLGGENWFALGDRDLATHIERTRRLAAGETLSAITADFAARLGIAQAIMPMSDDPIRTIVHTSEGILPFQDYFVRLHCAPVVKGLTFEGAEAASPSPGLCAVMQVARSAAASLSAPPTPSSASTLSWPCRASAPWLQGRNVPCIAISPLIGGKAVKGPAAKMMAELKLDATPRAIAQHYQGLIDGLIIDEADTANAFGECLVTNTLMRDVADRERLAREALAYIERLRPA